MGDAAPAQTAALREKFSEELKQWRLNRASMKDYTSKLENEAEFYWRFGIDAHKMDQGASACSRSMKSQ